MKIIGRKLPRGTVLLFTNFLFLTVSCILITTNKNGKELVGKLSRGFYSENVINIMVTETDQRNLWEDVLGRVDVIDVMLFKNNLDPYSDLRGVYYKGTIDLPPLKKGRFFYEDECMSEKRIALIGSSFEGDVTMRDGKEWIAIGGEEFEVIGVLGTKEASRFGFMRFIPMKAALDLYGEEGSYVVDALSGDAIGNAAKRLEEDLQDDAVVYISDPLGYEISGVQEKIGGTNETIRWIYIGIFLSFLFAAISCIGFWMSFQRQAILVHRMLGYDKRSIGLFFMRRYLVCAGLAFATGILIVLCMRFCGWLYPISKDDVLIAAGCTFGTGVLLISGWLVKQLNARTIRIRR